VLPTLRQPKWVIAGVVVVLVTAVFIRLGFWQLHRLEERRDRNQVSMSRIEAEPVPLETLLASNGDDLESLQYRRVTLSGVYDTSQEVLIRSQVELGQAGFHVITPFVLESGNAVLVNRGWVPITMDQPPVDAAPAQGSAVVEGWIHLTQTKPPFGPQEPAGHLDVFNRVDIRRVSEQVDEPLLGVYVVAMGEEGNELPIRVDPPDFTDEGPHLSYAIQWFAFATIALVGFVFLVRRGQSR
jgi:cytochrome oxidase assembly protein ShyY1